ncbi:hypothetical protein BJV74DRAFT_946926 [Russula compacta]|nr:hypothetical protein BJV74DRAFT_946926 [Russula compacta]
MRLGIVHTDLKHDNIFFDVGVSYEEIENWTKFDPSRSQQDGIVQAAVSQPLPLPSWDEALKTDISQPVADTKIEGITPLPLRPPEVFLGGSWNEEGGYMDIHEITLGKALIRYKHNPRYKLDEVESMLHQMSCLTGEDFEPEQLTTYTKASRYFDTTCEQYAIPDDLCSGLSKVLEKEEDVVSIAVIMQRCLRLDPAKRLSAKELLMLHGLPV